MNEFGVACRGRECYWLWWASSVDSLLLRDGSKGKPARSRDIRSRGIPIPVQPSNCSIVTLHYWHINTSYKKYFHIAVFLWGCFDKRHLLRLNRHTLNIMGETQQNNTANTNRWNQFLMLQVWSSTHTDPARHPHYVWVNTEGQETHYYCASAGETQRECVRLCWTVRCK